MTTLELSLLLLLAAVIGVVLFRMLSLPPMLGYLAVGILIGPHALGMVPKDEGTRYLAEFGVVFLMFSIGLEFSLSRLKTMRRAVFGLGMAQVACSILMVVAGGLGLAWLAPEFFRQGGLPGLIALGGAYAMSSTAIVVKILNERLELDSRHGRLILGVLLFQDLAVVPLLILVPALGMPLHELPWVLTVAAAKAATVLVLLLYFGQKLMRRWFFVVAKQRSQELFMLNLLLITLGLAWITEQAGLSLALGAFVAGMLISETEYRHQVEEDIKPFRDVLLGLFFITIGMLLNVRTVLDHFGLVVLLLTVPVGLKFGLIALLARWFGATPGVALRTGLGLAQAGEFGFVLLTQAGGLGLIEAPLLQAVLASMLLSMLAAPFLIQYSDRIVLRLSSTDWLQQSLALTQIARQTMATQKHVIICGYGRSGQNLARLLEQEQISYVALDLDPERVNEAASAGYSVVYGDAARRETLVAAGIGRAAAMVISYADTRSSLKVLHLCHELDPALPVIVRTFDDSDLEVLQAAGAAEVVPEIIEGSLMLASHALILLGVPMNRVVRRIREARDTRYQMLRGFFHGATDEADHPDAVHVRLRSVTTPEGAQVSGQSLGALRLSLLGVEVTAILRRGIRGIDPGPEAILQDGDALVLRGTSSALALAEEVLLKK